MLLKWLTMHTVSQSYGAWVETEWSWGKPLSRPLATVKNTIRDL